MDGQTIGGDVKSAILAHAREDFPNECCGLIVGDGKRTKSIRCKNDSSEPTQAFRFTVEDMAAVYADPTLSILAVYHSHPNGAAEFSEADIASSEAQKLPFLVVGWPASEELEAGEPLDDRVKWNFHVPTGNPIALEGRAFVHGILDCFSLVRDWYAQKMGISIPDFHRPDDWWDHGLDLYRDHFDACGFYQINARDLQYGDALLIQLCGKVPNHAAIYLGDNEILHHAPTRLSCRQPYTVDQGFYAKNTYCALRHYSVRDVPVDTFRPKE